MATEVARLHATLSADAARFVRAMNAANASMNATAARARALDGQLAATGVGMNKAGVAGTAAMRALKIGGVAAAVGIGIAVKQAADFESSLNTFQAVSKATNAQMGQMSSLAKKLGADVNLPGTSAADAADAMIALSKGGLSVTNTMKAAKGVLTLSAAAQIDNATAATITADALNAFGLSGDKATKVADLLAAASIAASGEITDTAMAMRMSATVASQMGVSVQDLTVMLASMAKAGLRGSDAGTSVKTMLMRLGAPTDKAEGAMKALGISVYDSAGQMRKMPQIIGQFENALRNKSAAERTAALQTIFGADAIRAANVLIARGVTGYASMSRAVNRQGAASDMAKAKMKGFNGALEALQSSMETLAITAGTPLLNSLTSVVRGFADFTGQLSESQGFKNFASDLGQIASSMMAVGRTAITVAAPAVGGLAQAMGTATTAAARIPGVVEVAGTAITAAFGVAAIGKITNMGRAIAQTAGGSAVGALAKGIGTVGVAFTQATVGAGRFAQKDVFAPYIKGMGRFSTAMTATKGALATVGTTLTSALGGPVGIGIAAVTGLTAGFFALRSAIGQTPTTAMAAANAMQALATATNNASNAASNYRAAVASYQGVAAQVVLAEDAVRLARENTRKVTAAANADGRVSVSESQAIKTAKAQETIAETNLTAARKQANAAGKGVIDSSKGQAEAMRAKTDRMLESVTATRDLIQPTALIGRSQSQITSAFRNANETATAYNQRLAALPGVIGKNITSLQSQRKAMVDNGGSKAQIKALDGIIAKYQAYQKDVKGLKPVKVPDPKPPKPVQFKAKDGVTPTVTSVLAAMAQVDGKTATTTITTRKVTVNETRKGGGGFTGGWVTGYATGGKVSGPSGKDAVPAMLTAGEVVLTKEQQRLVNGGMGIDAALRQTGGRRGVGGFATGGKVDTSGLAAKASSAQALIAPVTVAINLNEVMKSAREVGVAFSSEMQRTLTSQKSQLQAALKRATALQNQDNPSQKAVDAVKATIEKLRSQIASASGGLKAFADKLGPIKQRIVDTFKADTLKAFDRETQNVLANNARAYNGYAINVGGALQHVEGFFEANERTTRENLKRIEKTFVGTYKTMTGQQLSGSMKEFDKQMRAGQKSLTALYDSLTPAEAALKALNESSDAATLSANLEDARAQLATAQKWGDPAAIKDAQKALGEAERAASVAELTKTAEAQRAAQEEARTTAQEDFDTHWEEQRTALQEQLDGQLEQERVAGEDRRALLQTQLDTQNQQYEDDRARERAGLERRLEEWGQHFMRLRTMMTGNNKSILKQFRTFAEKIERSGANLGSSFAVGIGEAIPGIAKAAEKAGQTVAQYLKLNSPAEKGPLSDLDTFWNALGPTLASGAGSLDDELRQIAMLDAGSGRRAGGGGATTINLSVTDQTFAGMSREQADRVAREVQAALDRQVSFSL